MKKHKIMPFREGRDSNNPDSMETILTGAEKGETATVDDEKSSMETILGSAEKEDSIEEKDSKMPWEKLGELKEALPAILSELAGLDDENLAKIKLAGKIDEVLGMGGVGGMGTIEYSMAVKDIIEKEAPPVREIVQNPHIQSEFLFAIEKTFERLRGENE
jgi:hypothetical protein